MSGLLLDPSRLVILGVVALLAFATEGAIGFGGTVLAASIGAQFVPLEVLLPAFVPLNILMSSWLLGRGVRVVAWRMLLVEVAPAVGLGAIVGLVLFHLPAKTLLALIFGCFVVGLATLQLGRPMAKALPRPLQLALLGLGGVAHGLFGTGGPMIVYIVRPRLPDKLAFRSTLAVVWLVLNAALLANFASSHLYTRTTGWIGAVLAIALVPGLFLGNRLHHKLDAARFERLVWIVLLLAGIALAVRSAFSL